MQIKTFLLTWCLVFTTGSLLMAAELSDRALKQGMELYDKHCASCHGETGQGDGEAEYLLSPKPRDFSGGSFRLTSTESGLPSDADIVDTLRMGMAGSSMPSWGHFEDRDLETLAATVRHLAVEGKVADLLADDDRMTRKEALEIAHDVFEAGPVVKISPEPKPTPKQLAVGKDLYTANCANCHDADGRGKNKLDMKNDEGRAIFSRDFTQGIFKGGSGGVDLARRIRRGMPGTPMPGTDYTDDQLWAVTHYVQQFVKPGAQERVLQKQKIFVAARAEGVINPNPSHPDWSNYASTFVPVMPLWWRHDRIEGCELQAAHDGTKLAIRLSWSDATRDDSMLAQHGFTDGSAVQLSSSDDPPFFAMGAKDDEVSIWYWKAALTKDMARGRGTVADAHPNMPREPHNFGAPDGPPFHTGEHAGNPVSQTCPVSPVESLGAAGFGTLTTRGAAAQTITGEAHWEKGRWSVVFVSDLKDGAGATPGDTISIALALWDGAAGDRNGQKSVTIWHKLRIEG
ncbi:MAG: c-type cytochrome [Kiritimatiellia bacterium]|nr:c-type cytochrome [Kiritimatiellia bacterium]MDP6630433.1 c-type cytochrome [Kiritimatiellia bacterium]MDP6809890.1 c-type cytochrome [Kiritimatiellia bacterium]MDP7024282.1 c-type cytochrome [Kiritimatiellia bacterium]